MRNPNEDTTLVLDKYERDNLLALLHLCYCQPDGPPLGTGDWIGQIYWRLAPQGLDLVHSHNPNMDPADQLRNLLAWAKGIAGEARTE